MASNEISAGLLMYREGKGSIEYFLAHPGGPFFSKKDEGVWSIPKGLVEAGEDLLATAKREFAEETGIAVGNVEFLPLGEVKNKSGKTIHAWAFLCSATYNGAVCSNLFEMEWPPKSGKMASFPEIDRAEFFDYETAMKKIQPAQVPFLERIKGLLTQRP